MRPHRRYHKAVRTDAARFLQVLTLLTHRGQAAMISRHPRFPRFLTASPMLVLSMWAGIGTIPHTLILTHCIQYLLRFAGSIRANMAHMRPRPISDLEAPDIGFLQDTLMRPRPMSDLVAPGIGFPRIILAQPKLLQRLNSFASHN